MLMSVVARTRPLLFCLITVIAAAQVEAQQAAKSFDQLGSVLQSGDNVSLTDDSGREVTGRITRLSSSSLTMLIDGKEEEWMESQVGTIRRSRDSLKNGALWGLVSGTAFAVTLSVLMHEDSDGAGDTAGFVASYAGLGAAVGIGVDALINRRQILYRRPSSAATQYSISPMVTATRRGMQMTVSF